MIQSANKNISNKLKYAGLPIIAIIISLVFFFIALGIMGTLPRMGPKDQIRIPQELCFIGVSLIQIMLPWMIFLTTFRHSKLKRYFLIWLIIAFIIVNWLFGGFIAFDKAWRRGL